MNHKLPEGMEIESPVVFQIYYDNITGRMWWETNPDHPINVMLLIGMLHIVQNDLDEISAEMSEGDKEK